MTNEDIINEFPSLYNHKGMFDFSPPEGWLPLIYQLSKDLLPYDVKVVQVKSKFAGLRMYTAGDIVPAAQTLIYAAEDKSGSLCETCGEPGVRFSMPSGWSRVACEEHRK